MPANIIRLNREFPQTAIHQHAKPDGCRPAEVGDGVERRTNRTPRVENVVHNDDRSVGNVHRNLRLR
jgi:hypothetical protein